MISSPIYTVAVRALCEFTAKHGDLDLRFTPSPSAQEGMAGHALVASRRPEGYESEVSLEGHYKSLVVRGRADGYDPALNLLEEVKTFRGDLHTMAENRRTLHWAQLKIYGWLLCQQRGLEAINLSLVYFDVASLQETPLTECIDAQHLKDFFQLHCERFLAWAEQELAHRLARDVALTALKFPHPEFRAGQRELAEAVYKASHIGVCLLAQATTGIGKTIGTVFPLLKSMPKQRQDKLFFLAAKTPGRQLALEALDLLQQASALPLRALELVSREKSCEHPDKACHGDACPLARGFYDRLPAARSAAVLQAQNGAVLDKSELRKLALSHQVCPYYLSQELVRWSDVVVGDYNYYFDNSAMLYNMSQVWQWRVSVLVDEAHNLLERGRKMYSATMDQSALRALHATAPKAVKKVLERLDKSLTDLHKMQVEVWQVYAEIPIDFLKTLQLALSSITDFLLANPTRMDGALQDFYFEALHFSRMADAFGQHSLFDITLLDNPEQPLAPSQGCAALNIRNVLPAPFLAPRFALARTVTLFSATLSPRIFYSTTLGLPEGSAWVDVSSPFTASQLKVAAVSNISTRYQHREESLERIADLMARQYQAEPGNYLAFTSSYNYLAKLEKMFRQRYPFIHCWSQTKQMDETERKQFLARFTAQSQGIGFAVLGGAFAEGVDLPGRRLIGAFIATLGMPQINAINEAMKNRLASYMQQSGQSGQSAQSTTASQSTSAYNYTYLYPGLQKVVQAAGRVIRTPSDKGVIYLMDDRFNKADVRALLPTWWRVVRLHAP
jgi:DNA excision repair protein ERCC-2